MIAQWILVVTVLLGPPANPTDRMEPYRLLRAGGALTAEQAEALEANCREDPENIIDRLKLIGYYGISDARRVKHLLYMIEHFPEAGALADPRCHITRFDNSKAYETAAELWRRHVERHADNVAVLSNAASFFSINDPGEEQRILLIGRKLAPGNPIWTSQLGSSYLRTGKTAPALAVFEDGLKHADDLNKGWLMTQAADAAFANGDLAKAKAYAERLLDMVVEQPRDWNYGNAVHKGNIILGRLALRDDKIEEAEAYLLKAGRTPGSPQLNSFGPNMTLALDLLRKDRREAVLEYLQLCGKFWKNPNVAKWTAAIEAGNTPDFGANLMY